MTHILKQLIRPLSVLSLSAMMAMSPLASAASQEPDVLLRDTVEGLTTKIDSRESYYKDHVDELEALLAYVGAMRAADLGKALEHQ